MTTRAAPLARFEFIVLAGMLSAWTAFSIDAMLPAMDRIASELTPDAPNLAQLVITSYVLGLGFGTFLTGPLSDAIGRRAVMIGSALLFIFGAIISIFAASLELLLLARVVQGLGGAGPRVVMLAIVRDLYAGRQMAQIVSFIMVVFAIVPAIAPSIGYGVIELGGWRSIFVAFALFAGISIVWFALRMTETLPRAQRRPLRWRNFRSALAEMFGNRQVTLSLIALVFVFASLFATLSSTQPVFDKVFGRADRFHLWFAFISVVSGSFGFLNAALVERLGMVLITRLAFLSQVACAALMIVATLTLPVGGLLFGLYVAWVISVFSMVALTIGNLNAVALEPLGHISGMVTSMVSALSTIGAVLLAVPIGLAFDDTPIWPAVGIGLCALAGYLVVRRISEER